AFVSPQHGNFLAFEKNASTPARTDDMRELVETVQSAVRAKFGVELETEVVFWRRGEWRRGERP
ncbi:MAG: hypothetical protein ACKPBA_14255, partial [Planctomycetota bacterium]